MARPMPNGESPRDVVMIQMVSVRTLSIKKPVRLLPKEHFSVRDWKDLGEQGARKRSGGVDFFGLRRFQSRVGQNPPFARSKRAGGVVLPLSTLHGEAI